MISIIKMDDVDEIEKTYSSIPITVKLYHICSITGLCGVYTKEFFKSIKNLYNCEHTFLDSDLNSELSLHLKEKKS